MEEKTKKISLDTIAEFYIQKGYTGYKLRKILEKDKEYQKLISNKRKKISKKFKATKKEKAKYVLSIDKDFEILDKCKKLLKQKISKTDKEIIHLIKTQLEDEWRSPLIDYLNKLLKKYKK